MIEVRVQVLFSQETKYGIYKDALYFSEAEYAGLTKEDIDNHIASRVNNYLAIVETPTETSTAEMAEPTKEDLQLAKTELENQLADLNEKIAKKG